MEKEIIQKLISAMNALDSIHVSGRKDLSNMIGSLSIIEDVISTLSQCQVTPNQPPEQK